MVSGNCYNRELLSKKWSDIANNESDVESFVSEGLHQLLFESGLTTPSYTFLLYICIIVLFSRSARILMEGRLDSEWGSILQATYNALW